MKDTTEKKYSNNTVNIMLRIKFSKYLYMKRIIKYGVYILIKLCGFYFL